MAQETRLKVIARLRSEFSTKFGVPRQSGLVDGLRGTVVFEPEFRQSQALRGIEGFSHLWLIWGFSENVREDWSPTVRPPRLGGNERLGVFATRSPFRPNPLGLSCVKLERVELQGPEGPTLHVLGADLMDGTPIYDIKPYVPYADCHSEASEHYAHRPEAVLKVTWGEGVLESGVLERAGADRGVLEQVLAQDPRPHYQDDPQRVYGMVFGGMEVRFSVEGRTLTVRGVAPAGTEEKKSGQERKK